MLHLCFLSGLYVSLPSSGEDGTRPCWHGKGEACEIALWPRPTDITVPPPIG